MYFDLTLICRKLFLTARVIWCRTWLLLCQILWMQEVTLEVLKYFRIFWFAFDLPEIISDCQSHLMQEMTFALPKYLNVVSNFSDRKCFGKGRHAQASVDRPAFEITKTGFCKVTSGHFWLFGPKYLGIQRQTCSYEKLGITVQSRKSFNALGDFIFWVSYLRESKMEVFDLTNRTVPEKWFSDLIKEDGFASDSFYFWLSWADCTSGL
jgi:hypothetical protein